MSFCRQCDMIRTVVEHSNIQRANAVLCFHIDCRSLPPFLRSKDQERVNMWRVWIPQPQPQPQPRILQGMRSVGRGVTYSFTLEPVPWFVCACCRPCSCDGVLRLVCSINSSSDGASRSLESPWVLVLRRSDSPRRRHDRRWRPAQQ